MMKYEFEELVGHSVSTESYRRIDDVYEKCEVILNKKHIADIYKKYDMNGIETIYRVITGAGTPDMMEAAARYLRVGGRW